MRAHQGISILNGNHLCHNPRVIKEASALANAGYRVEVLGAWFDRDLKSQDQSLLDRISFTFRPVVDFTSDKGARLIGLAKSKLGRLAQHSLQLENVWQLNPSLAALKEAANESDAELFIVHSEAGMAVAADLLEKGKRVGVDMEDWFSEDLLPEARRLRPVKLLRGLESKLLRNAEHRICTSRSMAEAVAVEHDCEPPVVIYNAFPWRDRETIDGLTKDRKDRQLPSIHWYSQTLGRGRGLEDLFSALPLIKQDTEIHLRGKSESDFKQWIFQQVPNKWHDRIFIHDLVPSDELLSRIAEHDIGFAGEQKFCKSRDLTVTNKILHYLLGRIAVVASDTAGQREVAQQARGAVYLYRAGDPQDLALQLNRLLSSPDELTKARQAALVAAQETFCWEKQEPKLLESVRNALR